MCACCVCVMCAHMCVHFITYINVLLGNEPFIRAHCNHTIILKLLYSPRLIQRLVNNIRREKALYCNFRIIQFFHVVAFRSPIPIHTINPAPTNEYSYRHFFDPPIAPSILRDHLTFS